MTEPQYYTENDLAQRLGMSRTPVREALKRLRAEQLVVLRPKGGVYVPPIDLDKVEEVYALTALLQSHAAARLAKIATAEQLRRLREICILIEHNRQQGHRERLGELYGDFHRVIIESANMPLLAALMSQVESHLERFRRVTARATAVMLPSRKEHEEIIDALERHDAKAAERAAFRHIIRLKDAYILELRKAGFQAAFTRP